MYNLTKRLPASALLFKLGITTLLLLYLVLMNGNYSYAMVVDTSTTTISSSVSTTTFGETVTFAGRVVDTTNVPPTGTLIFMSGVDVLGEQPLATNSSPITITSMSTSSGYTPPANWKNACSTCSVLVWGDYVYWVFSDINNYSNYNIVAYDSNKAIVKQVPVSGDRYIAAITDNSNGTITLTGQSANIVVNLSLLDIVSAQFSTSSLAVGTHSITATYSGDNNHTGSVSNTVTQVVNNAVSYTVSFDSNGGTPVASQNVINNGMITIPTAPTRPGYSFTNWYSNIGDIQTPVTADTTLLAGWAVNYGLIGNGPNLAENSAGTGYPSISASYTCCQNQDNPWYAIDGIFSLNRWTNYGGNSTDWLAINFGTATTFNKVNLFLFNDGGGVQPPGSYNVQYWDGYVWLDAVNQVKSPATPTGSIYTNATVGNTFNTVTFDTVISNQIRVVFTNGNGYVGIVELEVFNEELIPPGEGTSASPYQISNKEQFQFMANHLSSHYVLMNDINIMGAWTPIGATSLNSFQGSLDGQGNSITGLSINSASTNIGLFGVIGASGVVKNLTINGAELVGNTYVGALAGSSQGSIANVIINNANVSGTDYVGALVGNHESGSIKDSHSSGVISAVHFVGGISGASSASITDSSSAVVVTGTGYYIAGMVGYLNNNGSITNSYASGSVTGPSNTGGLVGQNANSTITNSFALGSVSSGGSLVGYNYNGSIIDSYASGLVNGSGQVLTENYGTVTNSFWKPYIAYFDSNGGTTVNIQGLEIGGQVTIPNQPTMAGHTFDGWYSDEQLNTPYVFGVNISAFTPIYAKWLINSYTITFDSNGGELDANPTSQTVIYGNVLGSLPAAPTFTGHTFTGWNIQTDGNGTAFDAATVVTESTIVYAQWTINSYTVSFVSNGGTDAASQTVDYNGVVATPSVPTKVGYTFQAWYSDSGLSVPYTFTDLVIADLTLYAQWSINSYSVNFASNGGSAVISQELNYNTTALAPIDPTRVGYTFAGWYSDASLIVPYNFSTLVTGNITLYAKWIAISYTVTFESNDGTVASPSTIARDYGTSIGTLPTAPTRVGYTFAGWNTAADGTGTPFIAATLVTGGITVYAQWTINNYMVTFDKNGGDVDASPLTITVNYGTNVGILPIAPTRVGYTFVSWNTAADGTGTVFGGATLVTGGITVYAQWTINSYTVSYDKNGGDVDASSLTITVNYGTGVGTLPTEPTRTGYTFASWNTAADGTGTPFTAVTLVTGGITVYAQWTINNYMVTFDKNGGDVDASPLTITVNYGTNVGILPTAPTRVGYTFTGWNTAADGTGTPFTAATLVTGGITVYAQWTINIYEVSYDKNGGDVDASPLTKSANYGTNVGILPTAPTRTGYTFASWNTAANGMGTVFDGATLVTGGITVYAQWTINSYEVSFDKNGGDVDASPLTKSANYGTNVGILPTAPTRTGYTFAGWNTAANGMGTVFDGATLVTGGITVYAQWTINNYEVSFDKNGGDVDASPLTKSANYGTNVGILPTAPTRTGYTFAGWNTAANGMGTVFDGATLVTGGITVYAQWTINNYEVSFDKNGGDVDASPLTKSANYGTNVGILPTAPTRTGYTFAGWNTAANGMGTVFDGATLVMGGITVYAQWTINSYEVSFDKNGGDVDASPLTKSANYGTNVGILPTAPTRTGYTFAGWNTAANGMGTVFDGATLVMGGITVYAQWTINSYEVSFDKNGGDVDASPLTKSANYGTNVGILPTAPTRTGYTFASWNTAADGTGTPFTALTLVTGGITVYAQWTINSYEVSFDKNGGDVDASPLTITVNYGTNVGILPTAPTRVGYTFTGWNTAADGTGTPFTALTLVTGGITVYAQWTINSYEVSFDKNGGDVDASPLTITVNYGTGVGTLPTAPTRVGYTFTGWNTAADGTGTAFDGATLVTGGITVYAQWTINSYEVSYDKNGGDVDASPLTITVNYGTNLGTLPTAPTRVGYTFTGWNTAADGMGTMFDASTEVTEDIIVYAQWTINSYTVTFDSNGGTTVSSQSVIHNELATAPEAPTRDGYTFTGWHVDSAFNNEYNFSTQVIGTMTLYASWESYMEAETAVALTEIYQTQISLNEAYLTVIVLTNNVKKNELLSRIQAVQDMIDQSTIDITDVIRWINEGTFQEKDINQDKTFDSLDVRIMLQRITYIQLHY